MFLFSEKKNVLRFPGVIKLLHVFPWMLIEQNLNKTHTNINVEEELKEMRRKNAG